MSAVVSERLLEAFGTSSEKLRNEQKALDMELINAERTRADEALVRADEALVQANEAKAKADRYREMLIANGIDPDA